VGDLTEPVEGKSKFWFLDFGVRHPAPMLELWMIRAI